VTAQARLQKVTQGLSALQRITLVLRAEHEGREPDPELSHNSDPQQRKTYNRYVALLYVINQELGALCFTVSRFTEFLDSSAYQIRLLEQAAGILATDEGIEPARRPRDWRTTAQMPVSEFLLRVAREQRDDLLTMVGQRWRELAALETVWAECAEEFAGEDPVASELRSLADETKRKLLALAQEFGGKRRLKGPDEDSLVEARSRVDEAFERLAPLL
jgi:hypothetical protein